MRRIRHSIRRCNADRLEREGYARLWTEIASIVEYTAINRNSVPFELVTDPSLLYSICRNVIEDPATLELSI